MCAVRTFLAKDAGAGDRERWKAHGLPEKDYGGRKKAVLLANKKGKAVPVHGRSRENDGAFDCPIGQKEDYCTVTPVTCR